MIYPFSGFQLFLLSPSFLLFVGATISFVCALTQYVAVCNLDDDISNAEPVLDYVNKTSTKFKDKNIELRRFKLIREFRVLTLLGLTLVMLGLIFMLL